MKCEIEFTDSDSPHEMIPSESGHLVVCEQGHDLAEVIAANYAYAIGAGLCLIPQTSNEDAERIRERFYSLYDSREESPTAQLEQLRAELRLRAEAVPRERYQTITFISKEIPWGFAFDDVPTAHLFSYPDLGISLVNGIAAEQPNTPGIRIAAVIDPQAVEAPEVLLTAELLASRSVLVRGYRGPAATVSQVSRAIELLPYDFLLIATHCGDASGWRWTYEFTDSEGIERNLVVDLAIGIAHVPGREKMEVMQFTKFVSLDGVDWNDPQKKQQLYVGTAITDYVKRESGEDHWIPTKRETIPRVRWSSALKMFDSNFIPTPRPLADNGAPIIVNNACASWHRLAGTFSFGNARAYIGTLFGVSNSEAEEVVKRLLGRHYGKPLAVALWHAQNEVYEESVRRPYILVGTHFQRLRSTAGDTPSFLLDRLRRAETTWLERAKQLRLTAGDDSSELLSIQDYVSFLQGEIAGLVTYRNAPGTHTPAA